MVVGRRAGAIRVDKYGMSGMSATGEAGASGGWAGASGGWAGASGGLGRGIGRLGGGIGRLGRGIGRLGGGIGRLGRGFGRLGGGFGGGRGGSQDFCRGGDEFAFKAEAGADDGAVQAAGRSQPIPQDGGRGAGGGAHLVTDDGSPAGQCPA